MQVTKQEFVDRGRGAAASASSDAGKAVDAFLDTITDTLKRRDQINFTGFGKFSTSERTARMGVNPRDPGEKVHIPAATVPKFRQAARCKAVASKGG